VIRRLQIERDQTGSKQCAVGNREPNPSTAFMAKGALKASGVGLAERWSSASGTAEDGQLYDASGKSGTWDDAKDEEVVQIIGIGPGTTTPVQPERGMFISIKEEK
jgi:hypothetical protein